MSKRFRRMGLQFFAEPNPNPNPEPNPNPNPEPNPNPNPNPAPKMYSQEDVNRMMANEKRQGRSSVLRELGIDPEDKDGIKNAKATLDSHKTQQQLDSEALTNEKTARAEADKRAVTAERKLSLVTSGCKKEFVDEVMALASAKVTDTVDFDAAIKAVKEKCPAFFEEDGGDPGTGGGQGHRRQQQGKKPGDLGSRLAQGVVSSTPKENPYFKN